MDSREGGGVGEDVSKDCCSWSNTRRAIPFSLSFAWGAYLEKDANDCTCAAFFGSCARRLLVLILVRGDRLYGDISAIARSHFSQRLSAGGECALDQEGNRPLPGGWNRGGSGFSPFAFCASPPSSPPAKSSPPSTPSTPSSVAAAGGTHSESAVGSEENKPTGLVCAGSSLVVETSS